MPDEWLRVLIGIYLHGTGDIFLGRSWVSGVLAFMVVSANGRVAFAKGSPTIFFCHLRRLTCSRFLRVVAVLSTQSEALWGWGYSNAIVVGSDG